MNSADHTNEHRRDFLRTGAGLAAVGVLGTGCSAAGNTGAGGAHQSRFGKRARNVVFLIVDGMGQGVWSMADMAARTKHGRRSAWADLYERGLPMTQCTTHSANSQVTDSAAASCAWATGVHINNGSINIHNGRELEPILVTARRAGLATGLVTTTRVTHATPAGFIAAVPSRDREDEIAAQIIERRVDVVLGGGARHFPESLLRSAGDLTIVNTAAAMRDAASNTEGRLLGLFSSSHMAFDLDRPGNQPHLRDMSITALDNLRARGGNGFMLQIEAGRVDHGNHGNDIAASLFDQIAFDDTIKAVIDWAEQDGETLVIITTDHGCGGCELTLYGDGGNDGFDKLLGAKHTADWVRGQIPQRGAPDDLLAALETALSEAMAVTLTDRDRDYLARTVFGTKPGDAFTARSSASSVLGSVLANHLGVSWVSANHTSELVHATAFGPGSHAMKPLMDNIDLYGLALAALNIEPATST